jgi:hypothetical protein
VRIDAVAQDESPVTLAAARAEFDADVTYLDNASFGLPPRRSWMALSAGAGAVPGRYRRPGRLRPTDGHPHAAYAQLAGVSPSQVAIGSQVSVFAGLIAANLPDGSADRRPDAALRGLVCRR